jgi:hypothetical protein
MILFRNQLVFLGQVPVSGINPHFPASSQFAWSAIFESLMKVPKWLIEPAFYFQGCDFR